MSTLHIEHPITDYAVWKEAFDTFVDVRRSAGVRGYRVRRAVADPHYLVIDLDFSTAQQASSFLDILRSRVWSNAAASPALGGEPRTRDPRDAGR